MEKILVDFGVFQIVLYQFIISLIAMSFRTAGDFEFKVHSH